MKRARLQAVNPVLPCRDVPVSIDFYVARLGFALHFQDSVEAPGYAGLRRDDVELHLQWHDPAEWEAVERPSLRFVVPDVQALFEEYEDKGVFHDATAVRETPWGTREFAFFDPDSNGLTFYSDLEEADQDPPTQPAASGQQATPDPSEDLGTRHQFHGVQPVLPVRDVAASAAYFRDMLGFDVDFLAGDPPIHGRITKGDRTYGDPVYIHLTVAPPENVRPSGEIRIHVGHDIDGLYEKYQSLGVVIVEPPQSHPWGLREFSVREPNGHVIRFCGYVVDSGGTMPGVNWSEASSGGTHGLAKPR